jgi:site-specific DNA-methyltransferase (adenine-specific)
LSPGNCWFGRDAKLIQNLPMENAPAQPDFIAGFSLTNSDCVAGMAALDPDSVDVIVTSPPYNIGLEYGAYQDDQSREDYLDWCDLWAGQVARALKKSGSFFLNVGAAPANPWLPHELILRLRNQFCLQNTFHWIKSIAVETREGSIISTGHFKPINSERFVTDCHEYVFHLTRTGLVPLDRLAVGVPYAHKSNIARWGHTGGRDQRCRGNNWFVPYETIKNRKSDRPHPATFPIALAERCYRIHGLRDGLVAMDPFLGIGNAAVAARRCGIQRFIGFEIDAEYFAEAERRLREEWIV